ncbi:hypothetical protein [Kineosporia babensis]|uniref:Uncharacterized protein n=1 Tax=Kineosporia babensis TaxID=499548 RepID=A0A9X1NH14_9ACTN|nr:hypothetical protein [Kineosporia babensis]MCD5313354.1 hypothetical protein [Kineosporia babensis]
MRKTKLVAAVLVSAGLLFGASGTAMAVSSDTKPAETPRPAATVEDEVAEAVTTPAEKRQPTQEPTVAPSPDTTEEPTEARPVPADEIAEAVPAKPVRGNPSFTG